VIPLEQFLQAIHPIRRQQMDSVISLYGAVITAKFDMPLAAHLPSSNLFPMIRIHLETGKLEIWQRYPLDRDPDKTLEMAIKA